jgi:mRNA interferase MazF
MRQGEIWYADLNPTEGSEQTGTRPVVILSGNLMNEHFSLVVVVPLTTQIKRFKGNPVLIPNSKNGLSKESEILIFHIRSISKKRLAKKIGSIERHELDLSIRSVNEILNY